MILLTFVRALALITIAMGAFLLLDAPGINIPSYPGGLGAFLWVGGLLALAFVTPFPED